MSFHFLEVSQPGSRLKVRDNQIVLESEQKTTKEIPLEDTAAVIITSFDCSVHHSFLGGCGAENVPVLITCKDYKPKSVLLPAVRATDTSLLRSDWASDANFRQALWVRTISAKIENQAGLLTALQAPTTEITSLKKWVTGGPLHAREASAAKLFWSFWNKTLSTGFTRARKVPGLNSLLNYGYAVLASAVTQRLLAVGLDPVRGFGHRFRERACALTYDVMEPFRILVEHAVWTMKDEIDTAVDCNGKIQSNEIRRALGNALISEVGLEVFGDTGLRLIESTIRSLRRAILERNPVLYRPWKFKYTKWAGF
jgi:CRISPR-associated protein Cas1